jgi:PTS system N-acetylglucosamine-specific IIC component
MKMNVLGALQRIGKALMLPIAVLPAAAILLRLGAIEWGNPVMAQIAKVMLSAGDAVFSNLPLLFAIGVAVGLTDGAGAAALASVVGYLVLVSVLKNYSTEEMKLDTGVLGGIITGIVASSLYKRYHDIQLPAWLQFFGGKRFVPIAASFAMLFIGVAFGYIWPPVQMAISAAGNWIVGMGSAGAFIFGILNRLLIPFGLHHILNSLVWFNVGEFTKATGDIVHGDLTRFFAGDKTAGMFMTGFFPIMMFALPAACLAMIHEARKEQRKIVGGILISAALTAFLTGITEPIEFSFMFLAPVLYVVHAIFTGVAMALTWGLGIKHGFGFSGGAIDYVLNWGLATKPFLIIPIGLAFAVVYYFLFRIIIRKLNLQTPGRTEVSPEGIETESVLSTKDLGNKGKLNAKAAAVTEAVGGKENIIQLDACISRLRLTVKDDNKVDQTELKRLGAAGIMNLGKGNVQIVFGTESELIRDAMKKMQ